LQTTFLFGTKLFLETTCRISDKNVLRQVTIMQCKDCVLCFRRDPVIS